MKKFNNSGVLGNSIDICLDKCDKSAEIRADVRVEEFRSKRLWGQVLNCKGEPIANSLVKLVRVVCDKGRKFYQGVAHTITDCEGFYQFDICENQNECYKIIVNRAVTGKETVIDTRGGNCGACYGGPGGPGGNGGGGYNPCPEYNPEIRPYTQCECEVCYEDECGGYHIEDDYYGGYDCWDKPMQGAHCCPPSNGHVVKNSCGSNNSCGSKSGKSSCYSKKNYASYNK
ncbi:MAG: hypothetical protein RR539_05485 [Clostridium sp.]|uniref:hypothetical protein n=1 Tax=Clostridium sp. TaxID=1506 RepID=UPI002FC60353